MVLKLFTSTALMISLGVFTSCSKLEEMGENAENAGIAAGESREEIANGRLMTRSGNTSESRERSLERLLEADVFEGKEKYAAKYMYAQEMQFWTGQKYDSAAMYDRMKANAVKELFKDINYIYKKPLHKEDKHGDVKHTPLRGCAVAELIKIDFTRCKKKRNREMSIYALAVASHLIHDYQENFMVAKGGLPETTSMYDLIKQGLSDGLGQKSGILLEDASYQDLVEENREIAIEFVQMRLNMLLTIGLARTSPIKDSKIEAMRLLLSKKRTFNSKFLEMNYSQKRDLNKVLDGARKVKVFLQSINVEPKLDKKLVKFYSKMIVPEQHQLNKSSQLYNQNVDILAEHRNLLGEFFQIEGDKLKGLAQ